MFKNEKARGKIKTRNDFYIPIYFLTSTEFFLPSQNLNYGTKSQTLYKNKIDGEKILFKISIIPKIIL